METSSSGGFELSFNEDQKHLEEFYNDIQNKLNSSNIAISKIEHNQYHEKYYFKRHSEFAIFLFYYDGKKRFKKVVPEETTSNSLDLIKTIKGLL